MDDFWKPLNLDATRMGLVGHGDAPAKKEEIPVRSLRSRSIRFADEKEEAELMLETILLFEADDSFCEASVVEAVMDDFHNDSMNSFDSWEYAHGGMMLDEDDDDHGEPQLSLAELEAQVREQQAKELLEKQQGKSKQDDKDEGGIPMEIMAAFGGSFTNNNENNNNNSKSSLKMSPITSPVPPKKGSIRGNLSNSNNNLLYSNSGSNSGSNSSLNLNGSSMNFGDSSFNNSGMGMALARKKKPSRSISSHRAVPKANPNLRRALQKSSSLRMLEEAAENRRQREEDIQKRKAAETELKKVQDAQEQFERLQKEGGNVSLRRASFEPNNKAAAQAETKKPTIRRAFPQQEEQEEEPTLSTTKSAEDETTLSPTKRSGRVLPRRNRTFDGATSSADKPKPTRGRPKRTVSNFTGPRNMPLRRVRTAEPMATRPSKEEAGEEGNTAPETKKAAPLRRVQTHEPPKTRASMIVEEPEEEKKETAPTEQDVVTPPPPEPMQQKKEVVVQTKKKEETPKETKRSTSTSPKPSRRATVATPATTKKEISPTPAPAVSNTTTKARPSRRASTTSIPSKKESSLPNASSEQPPRRASSPSPRRSSGVASIKAKLEQQSATAAQQNAAAHSTPAPPPVRARRSFQNNNNNNSATANANVSTTAETTAVESPKMTPQPRRVSDKIAAAEKGTAKRTTSSSSETVKTAQQKRYDEIRAVQGLSMVGANTFQKRQEFAILLQKTTRAFFVRAAVTTVQAKIKHLQKHLVAMERSKQQEIEAIRNSPELQALRDEYQAATMTPSEINVEKERKELKNSMASVQNQNADIQQKMEDLKENSKRIARATRELERTMERMKQREQVLLGTQEQLRSKVEQLQAKVAAQTQEIKLKIRQTATEKQVGWLCHCTILQVRQHTKMVASTSDDPFLKKVHKRAQILDQLSKKRSKAKGKNGEQMAVPPEEVCPVILSR